MEFEYKQPKLKDSIYGEMGWEDDIDFEQYWFARVENDVHGEYEVLIYADSPADFMAVRGTHSTYNRILTELSQIKLESIRYIIENAEDVRFQRSRQKEFAVKKIESGLRLFCVKIYQDLSSEVVFDSEMFDETDEFIFTDLTADGELVESSIDTF